MKSIFLLGLVLFSTLTLAQDLPLISVTNASWGGKDVTRDARRHCDGNHSCDYRVSERYIGAAGSVLKTFSISWKCRANRVVFNHTIPHDASNSNFTIDCKKAIIPATHDAALFPVPGAPKWNADQYQYSLKKLALSSRSNTFNKWLAPSCVSALDSFYKAGYKLNSAYITNALSSILTFPFLGSNKVFYHYTNAPEVAQSASGNRPLDMFDFQRKLADPWSSVTYVADESETSRKYGNIQVRFMMRSTTTVLDEKGYREAGKRRSLGQNVIDDLIDQHSSLKACAKDATGLHDNTSLYFLAAEEMGVDMIRYTWDTGDGHWLQILNPYSIDKVETDI